MNARALGVQLLLGGQFRFQAGDVAGQLLAVERRCLDLGFDLGLGLLGLGGGFFRFRCHGGHGSLGRGFLRFRLGGRRWRDLLHFVVLERRDLGGLGNRLFIQGAAALLILLGEEVGLFRLLFAFEGGEGDFQGFADLLGFDHCKPDTQQQGQVDQRRQKKGKTEAIGRAHATVGEFGRQIGREGHDKETNIAFSQAAHDNAMLVWLINVP
ncbi:hypothetical protein EMIT0P291_220094 [Pseudomonas sp. IT-P291]